MGTWNEESLFEKIRSILRTLLSDMHQEEALQQILSAMSMETSLVEDMDIDSMRFVDLTVALEKELNLPEFPMQDWVDEEEIKQDKRYTVRSLVDYCLKLLSD
jgi:acyl carrier protein